MLPPKKPLTWNILTQISLEAMRCNILCRPCPVIRCLYTYRMSSVHLSYLSRNAPSSPFAFYFSWSLHTVAYQYRLRSPNFLRATFSATRQTAFLRKRRVGRRVHCRKEIDWGISASLQLSAPLTAQFSRQSRVAAERTSRQQGQFGKRKSATRVNGKKSATPTTAYRTLNRLVEGEGSGRIQDC